MKIGFTGTQVGISEKQKEKLRELIVEYKPDEVHHGDCVGADASFDQLCCSLAIKRVIHPPINQSKRAFCDGDVVLPAKYLNLQTGPVCS